MPVTSISIGKFELQPVEFIPRKRVTILFLTCKSHPSMKSQNRPYIRFYIDLLNPLDRTYQKIFVIFDAAGRAQNDNKKFPKYEFKNFPRPVRTIT